MTEDGRMAEVAALVGDPARANPSRLRTGARLKDAKHDTAMDTPGYRGRDGCPRTRPSNYPEPFASRMAKREKRPLGDLFGLENFGVNLTTLLPGGESALLHSDSMQDEFI
jgi:hypothetical protein